MTTITKTTPAPVTVAMTETEMRAEMGRLLAENEALKARPKGHASVKISEKGCVVVAGLGGFPTSLYPDQWELVLAASDQIRASCTLARAMLAKLSPEELAARKAATKARTAASKALLPKK
jgi:hypothetical protein